MQNRFHFAAALTRRFLSVLIAAALLFITVPAGMSAAADALALTDSVPTAGIFAAMNDTAHFSYNASSAGLLNVTLETDTEHPGSGSYITGGISDNFGNLIADISLPCDSAKTIFTVGVGAGTYLIDLRCTAFSKDARDYSITAALAASDACETEYNDTAATADPIVFEKTYSGASNTENDRDFFTVTLSGNTVRSFRLDGEAGSGSWEMVVFDSSMRQVAQGVCKTGSHLTLDSDVSSKCTIRVMPVTYTTAGYRLTVGSIETPEIVRLSGHSRIETAVEISRTGWPKGSSSVVVANGLNFADALAGVSLSAALDAPILLTANLEAPEYNFMAEIDRLGAKKIYILGGKAAVNDTIANKLASCGTVERISGSDRFGTAVKIAQKLASVSGKAPQKIFFANALNFPDALSAGPIAASMSSPILYIAPKAGFDKTTSDYIATLSCSNAVILGGSGAISATGEAAIKKSFKNVVRVSGSDRYETAAKLYHDFSDVFTGSGISVATGKNFPDALAGGALSAKLHMPLLLLGDSVSSSQCSIVDTVEPDRVYVYGGTSAVSDALIKKLF